MSVLEIIYHIYYIFLKKLVNTQCWICKYFLSIIPFFFTSLRIYTLRIPLLEELAIEKHIRIAKILFENQSFSKPKIFIDIGAGSGVYSFYFAKRGYIVLSIDADKRNFEYIQRMNKIFKKKLNLLPYAVSKKNGYSNFFLFRIPFIFISTLIPITSSSQSTEKLWKKLKVRTYTLDNLLKKLSITSRCNLLIKIDVEDMEYEVLLGMKKIIKLFVPFIVFENRGRNFLKIKNFFRQRFYEIYKVDNFNYLAIPHKYKKRND